MSGSEGIARFSLGNLLRGNGVMLCYYKNPDATAETIRDNAPLSVRQAKKAITTGLQMDRASGMLFEIEAYYQLIPTEDRVEGIKAYVEKRRPVFKGR